MVTQFRIDNAPVNNDVSCFLLGIKNPSHPSIDSAAFKRGGRSGVALATPYYRNFAFAVTLAIKGETFEDLVNQRDSIMALLKQNSDKTGEQRKRFSFVMSDGSLREVWGIITGVEGDVSADDATVTVIQVQIVTDREYFRGADATQTVYIFNGGGMSIPMAIPMSIAVQTASQIKTLTNAGNADSYPTMRVYGDMSSFDIINTTTNKALSCSQALATSADYIDFDFYNRTALLNGTTNVLDKITGTWWWLQQSDNLIKLSTESNSSVARAIITYHSAYLNL